MSESSKEMSAETKPEAQQGLPPLDNEPPTCAKCGDEYRLRDGDDPTKYCDHCAHKVVEVVEAELREARAALAEKETLIDKLEGQVGLARVSAHEAIEAKEKAEAALEAVKPLVEQLKSLFADVDVRNYANGESVERFTDTLADLRTRVEAAEARALAAERLANSYTSPCGHEGHLSNVAGRTDDISGQTIFCTTCLAIELAEKRGKAEGIRAADIAECARKIIATEAACIEWGADANRSLGMVVEAITELLKGTHDIR